jgi:uncharacterized membrane protein (DUF4010 family)
MTILAGMAGFTGPVVTEAPDSWTGLLTSGLAGAAAASAVVLTLYFRGRYHSPRDIASHFAASVVAVALLAFAAYDMRHAAFDYLGINSAKPAVEFEIRLPDAAALAIIAGTTRSNFIPTRTRRSPNCARGWPPPRTAAACCGDRFRWISAPPTASWC